MPVWLLMVLGILIGIVAVGGALLWAFWPRDESKSRRAPPSGNVDHYPYSGGGPDGYS